MKKINIFKNKKSLKSQLLYKFFIILITLLIIVGFSQWIIMKRYLYQSKVQVLDSKFHNIQIDKLVNIKTKQQLISNASYLLQNTIDINMSVAIIDNEGNIVSKNEEPQGDEGHKSLDKYKDPNENYGETPIIKLSNEEYLKLISQKGTLEGYKLCKDENNNLQIVLWRKIGDLDKPSGLMQLSTLTSPIQNILYRQLYIFIGASIIVIIIGGILELMSLNRSLGPLYKMTDTIEQINVGKLYKRLPENNGQIEIDKLSVAFNNMLERIESSFKQEQIIKEKMRHFVSDASHELRTPLTSIHGFVEVLLRGAAKSEQQLYSALNSILSESERLTKLVNDLLMLTKLDQKVMIEMKPENINEIINEIYPQLKMIGGERKIELNFENNMVAKVNRNQIKQVIINLFQNAVQHTDELQGVIKITTNSIEKLSRDFAVIQISDNGNGIPKENIEDIFDRFYRSETHRSRKHGGYGLGLAIVKSIVDAHNGTIDVKSQIEKGTSFYVYLPL